SVCNITQTYFGALDRPHHVPCTRLAIGGAHSGLIRIHAQRPGNGVSSRSTTVEHILQSSSRNTQLPSSHVSLINIPQSKKNTTCRAFDRETCTRQRKTRTRTNALAVSWYCQGAW
ncbi:hypothetical protein VOLCADRAFT_78899, partial [Volvox carteri f. nagariensis]